MDASRSLLDLLRPNPNIKERNIQESALAPPKGINETQSNFLSILMGKTADTLERNTSLSLKPVFQSEYLSNLIESKNECLLKETIKKERSSSNSDHPTTVSAAMMATASPSLTSSGPVSPGRSMTPSQNGLLSILLGDSPGIGATAESMNTSSVGASVANTSANTWTSGTGLTSVATSAITSLNTGGSAASVSLPPTPAVPVGTASVDEKIPKTMFTATNIFDQLSVTNPRMSDMKPKRILKAPPRTVDSNVSRPESEILSMKNTSITVDNFPHQKLSSKKEFEHGKTQGIRKIILPDTPFTRIVIPLAKNLGSYDKIEVTEIARLASTYDSLNNHTIDADKNYLAYAIPKDGNLRLMNQDDGSHVLLIGQSGSKIHDVLFSKYTTNSNNATYLMTTNSKGGVIVWHILKSSFNNPSKSVKMVFRFNGEHSMSNTEIKAKFCPILNIIAIKLLNRIYFFRFSSDRFEEIQRSEISMSNTNIGFVVAEKFIEDFAFSPDGRVLVTIHEDGTAELWIIYEHIENSIKFVISTPTLSYAISNEPLFWVSFIGPKQPNAPSKYLVFGLKHNKKFYLLDLDTGSVSQELVLTGNSENANSEISSIALYDNSSQSLIVNDHFGFLYRFHYNNRDLEEPMTQDSYLQILSSKNMTVDASSKNWSLFDSFYIVSFISKKTLYNFNVVLSNDSTLDLFTAHDKGYTILHLPISKQEIASEELSDSNIHTYAAQCVMISEDNDTVVKGLNQNKELSIEQKNVLDVKFQDVSNHEKQETNKNTKRKKAKNDDIFSINKKEINNNIESTDINSSFNTLTIDDNSYSASDQAILKYFKTFSIEFNKQNKKIDDFMSQRDEIKINQEKLLLQICENLNNNIKELIEKNISISIKNNILPAINKSFSNTSERQMAQLIPSIKKISQELSTEIHNAYIKFMDKTSLVKDISENLEKNIIKTLNSEIQSFMKGFIAQIQDFFLQKISQIENKYDEKIDSLLKYIYEEKKKDQSSTETILNNILSLEKKFSTLLSKINIDKLTTESQNVSLDSLKEPHISKEEVAFSFKNLLAKCHYNDALAMWVQSPYKAEIFDMFVTLDPKIMMGNASYIILFSVANALSEMMEDVNDPLMEKKLQWLEICFKLLMAMENHHFSGITLQILILIENRMDNLYERLRRVVPRVSYLRIVLSILHFAGELRQFFNV